MKIIEETKNNFTEQKIVYNFVMTGARINDALPTTLDHNAGTTGKQGGTTDEYYHNTADESAGISGADNLSGINPAATKKELFLKNGASGHPIDGASGNLTPINNRVHTFTDNGTDTEYTLTLVKNLSTAISDFYVLRLDKSFADGKSVKIILGNGLDATLTKDSAVLVEYKATDEFVVISSSETVELKARIKVISGAHTLTAGDAGYIIDVDGDITLPEAATEVLPDNFWCAINNVSAGTITVLTEGTDTLKTKGSLYDLEQYGGATLVKRGAGDYFGWGGFS